MIKRSSLCTQLSIYRDFRGMTISRSFAQLNLIYGWRHYPQDYATRFFRRLSTKISTEFLRHVFRLLQKAVSQVSSDLICQRARLYSLQTVITSRPPTSLEITPARPF
jgi:hypothetical protein